MRVPTVGEMPNVRKGMLPKARKTPKGEKEATCRNAKGRGEDKSDEDAKGKEDVAKKAAHGEDAKGEKECKR